MCPIELPPQKRKGDGLLADEANMWTSGLQQLSQRIGIGNTMNGVSQSGTSRRVKYSGSTAAPSYGVVLLKGLLLSSGVSARREKIAEVDKPDLSLGWVDLAIAGPTGLTKNTVGNVLISGLSAVRIDIQDTAHNYADIQDSSHLLISGYQGRAKIKWRETAETGEQWAIVEFPTDEWTWKKIYSAVEIDPHSFAELDSFTANNEQDDYHTVKVPTADSLDAPKTCITGADGIGAGMYSVGIFGGDPATIVIDGDLPEIGDDVGTVDGQTYGKKDNTGRMASSGASGVALVSPFSISDWKYYEVEWPPSQLTEINESTWDSATFTLFDSSDSTTVTTDWLEIRDKNTGTATTAQTDRGNGTCNEFFFPIAHIWARGVGANQGYVKIYGFSTYLGLRFDDSFEAYSISGPSFSGTSGSGPSAFVIGDIIGTPGGGGQIVVPSHFGHENITHISYKFIIYVNKNPGDPDVDYKFTVFTNLITANTEKHYFGVSKKRTTLEIP